MLFTKRYNYFPLIYVGKFDVFMKLARVVLHVPRPLCIKYTLANHYN